MRSSSVIAEPLVILVNNIISSAASYLLVLSSDATKRQRSPHVVNSTTN